MLDIIIPHYTESWEVGKKFFVMLDLQRGIDFNQIHVILVNDGLENSFPEEYFQDKKYSFQQITIPHAGVSAARNKGLEEARNEWVMFCDFDDLFSNVYSLRDYLNVLPAPDFDMLWADMYMEDSRNPGKFNIYNRNTENMVFTHSKIYRRKFLIENNIRFDTGLTFNEDSQFNAEIHTVMPYQRDGHIKTEMPPYIWCWRSDSTTKQGDRKFEAILCHYQRNKNVTELHRQRLPYYRHTGMVARTVWDAYYALNHEPKYSELDGMLEDFKEWYKGREKLFADVDIKTMKEVFAISYAESIDEWVDDEVLSEVPNFMDEFRKVKAWLKAIEMEDKKE